MFKLKNTKHITMTLLLGVLLACTPMAAFAEEEITINVEDTNENGDSVDSAEETAVETNEKKDEVPTKEATSEESVSTQNDSDDTLPSDTSNDTELPIEDINNNDDASLVEPLPIDENAPKTEYGELRISADRSELPSATTGAIEVIVYKDNENISFEMPIDVYAISKTLQAGQYTLDARVISLKTSDGKDVDVQIDIDEKNVNVTEKETAEVSLKITPKDTRQEKTTNPFLKFLDQNKIVLVLLVACIIYLQYKKAQRNRYEVDDNNYE